MTPDENERWLMEHRREIAAGELRPSKLCTKWDPEACQFCPCPSFSLLPKEERVKLLVAEWRKNLRRGGTFSN